MPLLIWRGFSWEVSNFKDMKPISPFILVFVVRLTGPEAEIIVVS